MAHNADRVLLGNSGSSLKEVSNRKGSVAAGLAVYLASDDTIGAAKGSGGLLGISVGKDMSDIGRTAICRKGLLVPIQLTTGFDPSIGAQVRIDDTTGKAVTSGGTALNAVYASSRVSTLNKGGIAEDATSEVDGTVGVALIDFPGGL